MNLTKLDVMTGIPKIQVATHYELNGRRLEGAMPGTIEDLAKCETKYVEMKGWEEDISTCTSFDQLPRNA